MQAPYNYVLPPGKSLGLKVVHSDGRPEFKNADGFLWDLTPGGETVAQNWSPDPLDGGGLHLWAWAQGEIWYSSIWRSDDVLWLVVEYETAEAVEMRGMVKVPKCLTVAISADRAEVAEFIRHYTPEVEKKELSFFESRTVGDLTTVAVGVGGWVVAGDYCEIRAGDASIVCAGAYCSITAGNAYPLGDIMTKVTAGKGSRVYAADEGNVEVGDDGIAQVGNCGLAKAGDRGRAIAGTDGLAIVGRDGEALVGEGGIGRAGENSKIHISWYDGERDRVRTRILYVGEDEIKPDTFYGVGANGDVKEVADTERVSHFYSFYYGRDI